MSTLLRVRKTWKLTWNKRRQVEGYLFVSPWIIGLAVFFAYPLAYAAYIAFTRWQVVGTSQWVGLDNFRLMLNDDLVAKSLKVTVVYTVISVPLRLLVGLFMAYLLNQKVRGLSVFRTIYYLPAVLSGPAIAVLWQWMFNTQFGLVNTLLRLVGVNDPIPWLESREWIMPFFVINSLWTVGHSIILYLAGLQNVPTELYEASEVDGANGLQKLLFITLPMMSPVIFFSLVTTIIDSFRVFDLAYVVTDGGPANSSLFYYLYTYRMGFRYGRLGYASALAWVLFIILTIVTVVIFKTSGAWVYYEAEPEGGE